MQARHRLFLVIVMDSHPTLITSALCSLDLQRLDLQATTPKRAVQGSGR